MNGYISYWDDTKKRTLQLDESSTFTLRTPIMGITQLHIDTPGVEVDLDDDGHFTVTIPNDASITIVHETLVIR